MTILFVIDGLGGGGAERSLAELLRPLADAGTRAVVACLKPAQGGLEAELTAAGFDVRMLRARGLGRRVAELRGLIASVRPDVVHTALFDADLTGRLAALRTSVPVLTSLVNTSYDPARLADPRVPGWKLGAVKRIDGWTARHLTSHFHAISHAVKASSVAELGIPAERITVIERGRDAERLGAPSPERRAAARRALRLSDDDEIVANVGRQEFQKGQRHLVEAIGRLAAERPRLVLLQAGRPGHLSGELEEAADRSGAGERMRFLGHRDDVPELLAAADLFAFPSIYEGMGGAVIEAMALGLPVIASDLPALGEVLEPDGNAVLVPPADGGALARAIGELLDDPARRRAFGGRSREIFLARFGLERSAARFVALYEELARAARPPAGSRA